MGLLDGKVGLIYGVRNDRSLGWGCASSIAREGGRLILAVYGDREQAEAEKLLATLPGGENGIVAQCDLTKDDSIAALHTLIGEKVGKLDFMIHCVAFAKKEELGGRYVDSSRDGFALAMDSSAFSFVAAVKAAEPLMTGGGSMLTLTYLGSEKVVPNYNAMGVAKAALESSVRYMASDLGPQGIRVNALSPGPTMTLAAAGISFHYLEYGSYFSEWRRRNALKMWTGWPTFPMVFVKGSLVGGGKEIEALIASGELKRTLGE